MPARATASTQARAASGEAASGFSHRSGLAGIRHDPDDLLVRERRRRHVDATDGRVADEFGDAAGHRDRGVRCRRIVGGHDREGRIRLDAFREAPAHRAEADNSNAVHN